MLEASIEFAQVLSVVDNAIKPAYLNKVQRIVLRDTWEGRTYSEIASRYSYDSEYIKSVGCELWQLLSRAFGAPVNKSNFQSFIRRHAITIVTTTNGKTTKDSPHSVRDWGTAPDVSAFHGRTQELECLRQWMNDQRCQLVIISGMIGIGKSALTAKFAEQVQEQFDYIIWRSLRNAPPVEEILGTLIRFFSHDQIAELPTTLNDKIVLLLSYLRQHRCLIVLDDLQSVLGNGSYTNPYRAGYEGYGQLFRSFVSTRHQSFLAITSWDKPKGLALYEGDKVQSLVLRGLPKEELQEIFQARMSDSQLQTQWHLLMERCADNPQLLKIATSEIQKIFCGNVTQFLFQEVSVSEEIRTLLDQQFNRLPTIEKKIAYWLAIKRLPVSIDQLAADLLQPISLAKLMEALISLEQRSLIKKDDYGYFLQPLLVEYLSWKLVEKICQDDWLSEPVRETLP
ncbi:MAG: NB-ARC domain-containing protein [Cyanophyceae cyanobacterium]